MKNSKALIFACSVAMAGVFAFSGSATTYAGANSNTAVAGASAAMASAVASADAEVAAVENAKAEEAVKSTVKAAKTEVKAQDNAETEAKAQEEADKAAAETQAAVEQAIAEQEYKNSLGAAEDEDVENLQASADSDVEGESVEGISWNGNKASEVVNYATEFVGNPYVWGGTSLTHGTDCSGFTMSVYKHFGKSIPHSSSGQRSVGKAVSVNEMKPGDIVCYDGHVALYCGNDTIVHASNPSTGIKYGNVYYRQIVAVRRLF